MFDIDKDSWNAWSKHVLKELEELNDDMKEIKELRHTDREHLTAKITQVRDELMGRFGSIDKQVSNIRTELNIRAGNRGAIMGAVMGIVSSIIVGMILFGLKMKDVDAPDVEVPSNNKQEQTVEMILPDELKLREAERLRFV